MFSERNTSDSNANEVEEPHGSELDRSRRRMEARAAAEELAKNNEWKRLAPFRHDLYKLEYEYFKKNVPKRLVNIYSEAEKEVEEREGVELSRKHIFLFRGNPLQFKPGQSEFPGSEDHKSFALSSSIEEKGEQRWGLVVSNNISEDVLKMWRNGNLGGLDIIAYCYFCTNYEQTTRRGELLPDYCVKLGYIIDQKSKGDKQKPEFRIRYFVGDGNFNNFEHDKNHVRDLNGDTLDSIGEFMVTALDKRAYKKHGMSTVLRLEPEKHDRLPAAVLDRIHNERNNTIVRKNQQKEEEFEQFQLRQKVLAELRERKKRDPNFKWPSGVPTDTVFLSEETTFGWKETYSDEEFYNDLNKAFPPGSDPVN